MLTEREKEGVEVVREIPQIPEIPEHMENEGVQVAPSQFTAQVKQGGQNLIATPLSQQVTITLPADQTTLTMLSRGSITNAVTWIAVFWLRMIKKAFLYGWRVVTNVRRDNTNN